MKVFAYVLCQPLLRFLQTRDELLQESADAAFARHLIDRVLAAISMIADHAPVFVSQVMLDEMLANDRAILVVREAIAEFGESLYGDDYICDTNADLVEQVEFLEDLGIRIVSNLPQNIGELTFQNLFEIAAYPPKTKANTKTLGRPDPNYPLPIQPFFQEGTFTVGTTGKVTINSLSDGGSYAGELAIFNLTEMEHLVNDSTAFITEALKRSNSHSSLGTVVISDLKEGAKYNLSLGASLQDSDRQINLASDHSPIFSMFQPENENLFGQRLLAQIDSNTIGIEDIHSELSDLDYNDLVIKLDGASVTAKPIQDNYILDWLGRNPGVSQHPTAKPTILVAPQR
jgi:hypothetical protein